MKQFKSRIKDLQDPEGENGEICKIFEHHLFKIHTCNSNCVKTFPVGPKGRGLGERVKVCPQEGKVMEPREPELMKTIHLFFKEPTLYNGIKGFLHLFLR